MPLKPCYECAHQVSTTATKCPNCGAPLKEDFLQVLVGRKPKAGSPVETNWPLRLAFVIGILVLGFLFWMWYASQRP
jgi:predicted amidophosphoribosyltransferase